ncbi:MAG: MOSC domain-containing protein [Nesterenkonia sp.]|nr:MOSC domain-containing protein [Nesterenkonia sp.]
MSETSPACHLAAAQRWGLSGTVRAVCVVRRLVDDPEGRVGVSAIDKRPVDGPVMVRRFGLHGDVQADRQHHGGEDKAVYAYADSDAAWWADRLDEHVPPGRFGENLRLDGLDVTDAVAGERWRVGETLILEVTGPRIPCATFGRSMGRAGWVRRFLEAGRPGAYLKVVTPGEVSTGDRVEIISVAEGTGPTVGGAARSRVR